MRIERLWHSRPTSPLWFYNTCTILVQHVWITLLLCHVSERALSSKLPFFVVLAALCHEVKLKLTDTAREKEFFVQAWVI